MRTTYLCPAVFALTLASAAGQAKKLTNDPSTGLPLNPATSYRGDFVGTT
jgi:hypothetical protein